MKIAHLLFALLFCLSSYGKQYKIEKVDFKSYLNNTKINCITKDKFGFIWLGTNNGILRYNSHNIIKYQTTNSNLLGDEIKVIYQDFEGILWIGTNKGICSYNYSKGNFEPLDFFEFEINDIKRVFNTGNFCIATEKGLFIDTVRFYKKIYGQNNHDEIFEIVENRNSKRNITKECFKQIIKDNVTTIDYCWEILYFGTKNGLFSLNLNELERRERKQLDEPIESVLLHNRNELIVNTYQNNYYIFKSGLEKLRNENINSSFVLRENTSTYKNVDELDDSKLLEALETRSSLIYDAKSDLQIKKDTILIQCYLWDNNGIIWIGNERGELFKMAPNRLGCYFYNENTPDLFSTEPNSSFASVIYGHPESKNIWVGTNTGYLKLYNRISKKLVNCWKITNGAKITSIFRAYKKIWIGTDGEGIYYSMYADSIPKKQLLESLVIFDIQKKKYFNSNRYLLVATNKGLYEINQSNLTIKKHTDNKNYPNESSVHSFIQNNRQNDNIWIGSNGYSYFQNYNRNLGKFEPLGGGLNKLQSSVHGAQVNSLVKSYKNRNYIWLGTQNHGLLRYDQDRNIIIPVDDKELLDKNCIINIDHSLFSEKLWISTKDGLLTFDIDKQEFDENKYLIDNEKGTTYLFPESANTLYIGENKSLVQIDIQFDQTKENSQSRESMLPIPIYITGSRSKHKKNEYPNKSLELEFDELTLKNAGRINVSYNDSLKIEFNAIEYNFPELTRFNWDYKKSNGEIIDRRRNSSLSYFDGTIPIGKSHLKVWGSNFFGHVDINSASTITIIQWPPYWIIFLILITTLILLFFIIKKINYHLGKYYLKKHESKQKKNIAFKNIINDYSSKLSNVNSLNELVNIIYESCLKLEFHYFSLSIINSFNNEIKIKKTEPFNNQIHDDWLKISFSLNSETVYSYVCSQNNNPVIKSSKVDEHLIRKIHSNDGHKKLTSFFIPIIFQLDNEFSNISNKNRIKIGIVETGYRKGQKESFSKNENTKQLIRLVKNSAQSFNKFFEHQYSQQIDNFINKIKNERPGKSSHLYEILNLCISFVDSKNGYMLLNTYNSNSELPDKIVARYPLDNDLDIKQLYSKIKEDKNKISGNRSRLIQVTKEINNFQFLLLPIKYNDYQMGIMIIFLESIERITYNTAQFLEIAANRAFNRFVKDMLNVAIKNIVLPFNVFWPKKILYNKLISHIRNYIFADYVGVWEIDAQKKNLNLICLTKKFEEDYACIRKSVELNKTTLFKSINNKNTERVEILKTDELKEYNASLFSFCMKYDFKAIINIPLYRNQKTTGYIIIFSKRESIYIFPEEIIFFNYLINKGVSTLYPATLIEKYNKIWKLLTSSGQTKAFESIVVEAQNNLQSNSVMYFPIKPWDVNKIQISIICKEDGTTKVKKSGDVEFKIASLIIKNGSQVFNNTNELKTFFRNNHFEIPRKDIDDYMFNWNIDSMAAIRIEYETKPIGVLIFNFNKLKIDNEIKKNIDEFATLYSHIIGCSDLIEQNLAYQENVAKFSKLENENMIILGLIHGSKNKVDAMAINYYVFQREIESQNCIANKEVNHFLSLLKVSLDHLNNDFKSLKDYRKFSNFNNFERVNIKDLIFDSLLIITNRIKSVKVEKEIQDIMLDCNPILIRNVLLNLFINSIEAMEDKKELYIQTQVIENEKKLVIMLQDSGPGISEDFEPYIFEPFYSSKGSSGIGLSASKKIMEAHSGKILLIKNDKPGACFQLEFPLNKK